MIDMRHYMTDDATTQVFEVVYLGKGVGDVQKSERPSKFLFVALSELETYMFPQEHTDLKKYLQCSPTSYLFNFYLNNYEQTNYRHWRRNGDRSVI